MPRIRIIALALGWMACAGGPAVDLEAAGTNADAEVPSAFTLLSYNVHGLFPLAAKDDPRDRMPTIGWLANKYDVILFQEDFEYHDTLGEQLEDSVGVRGNGMGWDPRRVLARLVLSPAVILVPHFSAPYGDGVSTWAERPIVLRAVTREPYSRCNGWFGENGDCWARKGFLHVRLRLPSGAEVDVYNTHLEAGPSESSVATRRSQLEELAAGIERLSPDRAVVVAGDFNVSFVRLGDRAMMRAFRERLGLDDSGAGPELPFWRERDYVLYRSGARARLSVEEAGEATEFAGRQRALSDHAALRVRFRVEAFAP
jgi:endonuclease/exonuclease/phosphatase family metal-dependent hydrolase